jgi:hypothetical protein
MRHADGSASDLAVLASFFDSLGGPPDEPPAERKRPGRFHVADERDYVLGDGPIDGITDDFLRDVARAYASAVARGEPSNKAISHQTGWPIKSVQRWVYTARQRGIMPRGQRGVSANGEHREACP